MKISLKAITFFAAVAMALPFAAFAATSFPQCPAVGADTTGCELLITVTAVNGSGAATAFNVTASSPDLGPYDSSDDTLVGILNSSGGTLSSIGLSGGAIDIFGFEGDGACTYIACPGTTDPSGYAPAGVTFSGINAAATSGTVNFGPALGNGSSSWFSLEEALTVNSLAPSAPEPATFALAGAGGLVALFAARRRRKA
jgi:hypothetical protein